MIDIFNQESLEKWASETEKLLGSIRFPYRIEFDNWDDVDRLDEYKEEALNLIESISGPIGRINNMLCTLRDRVEDCYCEVVEPENMDFAEVWSEEIL